MAQEYDNLTKRLFTDYATDISQFVVGTDRVEVIKDINTEQQIVIGQRTDSTKQVRIDGSEAILHIELQLRDSTHKPMWARNAAYHGYLIGEHQLPVYSNVIYFHRTAGRNDTGVYHYSSHGYEYTLRYKVIRLIDIDGQSVLEMQAPGLLPFTPLMKPPPGMKIKEWVQTCVDAVVETPIDQQARGDLLCAISLFGGIVYDARLFRQLIPEALMQESKYYQLLREEFIAKGREEGTRETTIRNTLTLLRSKFAANDVDEVVPVLQHVTDMQQLEQLLLAAAQVQNLNAFKLMLEEQR
ncbi:MAG: hypothetical protein OXU51_00855 [Candidatus Poribacteria bacterium]|nr:hypothetical protein [Candidatus Poribacteria bacterium]